MPKAKLSQIAATWVDEDHNTKKKEPIQEKNSEKVKKLIKPVKKKQTFNLKEETINRLWAQRVKSGKTISKIIDELVDKNLPKEKN